MRPKTQRIGSHESFAPYCCPLTRPDRTKPVQRVMAAYPRDPFYDPPSRRAVSASQPSPTGMIIHAVMAATLRREGDLKPTLRARTLAPARRQCPISAG